MCETVCGEVQTTWLQQEQGNRNGAALYNLVFSHYGHEIAVVVMADMVESVAMGFVEDSTSVSNMF